jgi:hypothetical protein
MNEIDRYEFEQEAPKEVRGCQCQLEALALVAGCAYEVDFTAAMYG